MKPALNQTSVPAWAIAPTRPPADPTGRSWTVVSFGADEIVGDWTAQIAARFGEDAVRVHRVDTDDAAREAVESDAAAAVVGWRLMIAGPADVCARLRAVAERLGVNDDELTIASTGVDTRDVACAHCGTTTRAVVELEQVVRCTGCGRGLFVYYHLSRRAGAHLGFLADVTEGAR